MKNNNFNIYGAYSLFLRESWRFLKVYNQTIVGPVVNLLIFLSIFFLALGKLKGEIHGIPYLHFIAYGLMMMSIIQNAFANTSSSLLLSKYIGYIIDIIIPPLSSLEVICAMVAAGVVRALAVGVACWAALIFVVPFNFEHPVVTLYYVLSTSMLMALLGILSGIIAESIEQSSAITNYIITPLSFLSGTFYSAASLPKFAQIINQYNPFFYAIDGFRYGITGVHESSIIFGMSYLAGLIFVVFAFVWYLMHVGWRIKN